jgi:hypothetical protein
MLYAEDVGGPGQAPRPSPTALYKNPSVLSDGNTVYAVDIHQTSGIKIMFVFGQKGGTGES